MWNVQGYTLTWACLCLSSIFRCPWNIFWALDKGPKDAITELYTHLSYASLSSANDFNFDSLLDLISGLTFKMKGSTLANRDKQQKKD